ncbi:MAG: glycosyltransferase family 4 protein [Elusimicrobiales bacterium]|jgi:glycosyltransferase involved in cell wall biosynthesis|nr:glycosyltransferase family 4 protein [Elusimicrobiales bacterium]
MRLTFLINSLGGGGAEKAITLLAESLARRGHDSRIVTVDPTVPDFHPVPAGVERASLGADGSPCRWFEPLRHLRRIKALRRTVTEGAPDALISFIDATNVLALAAFPGGAPPVVACERLDPRFSLTGPHWRFLRRLLYPKAAAVVVQTKAAAEAVDRYGWRTVTIPNPAVPYPREAGKPEFLRLGHNIAAAGRLTRQKGFDLLLGAFARIAPSFPDWQLTIAGEGPERAGLEKLASELGLAGRAVFPGALPSLAGLLRNSDLFALSSRFEGFPNVLAEALACGLPAVSFDCPSGPAELMRDGVDGLLVPPGDEKALAEALAALMGDEGRRRAMSAAAPDVLRRFSMGAIVDEWERLLTEVRRGAGDRGRPR